MMGDDEPDHDPPEHDPPEHDPPDHDPALDWEEEESESPFIHWPRDPQLDPARSDLLKWFEGNRTGVFYGRQIEVIFEKKYFHWITHKALRELTKEEVIATEIRVTAGGNKLRLYWSKRNRYPKRAAAAIVQQVEEHSNPELTRAIGHYAETLFGFAAAREGLKVYGPSTRSFQSRAWYETEHDLDWIFERDSLAWGVEIKNTWAYIDRNEMYTKIALCAYLGVKPLFIMRWAPKSYVELIRQAGGFGLLFETQLFPVGHTAAVEKLKELLLPVSSPIAVPDGVFQRFLKYGHEAQRKR
jgi:hypothetical protein